MNRNKNFGYCQGIGNLEVVIPEDVKVETQKSDKDRVLEMIYCADPETGLPQSDVGFFMSRDTPDVVRDFIERNIFVGEGQKVDPPSGVDDDTIIALTRDRYETREQYVKRVNDFMTRQKDEFESGIKRSIVEKSKKNSKDE